EDRARDFFYAWRDCIERYALAEQVSFVLIAGDFFDARKVEPQAMNQAMYCLTALREAGFRSWRSKEITIATNQRASSVGCGAYPRGGSSSCSSRFTMTASSSSAPGTIINAKGHLSTLTASAYSARSGTVRQSASRSRP